MKRIITLTLAGFLFCSACMTVPAASFGGSKDGTKTGGGKKTQPVAAQVPVPPAIANEVEAKLVSGDIAGAIARYEAVVGPLSDQATNDMTLARSKIAAAVASISVTAVSSPEPTTAKKAFKSNFAVRVTGVSGEPMRGVPVRIEAPSFDESGRVSVTEIEAVSGEGGLVTYEAPPPSRSADAAVRFFVAYRSADALLGEALKNASDERFAAIPYLAGTLNKAVPTSIAFLDYGSNDKPLTGMGLTATACLKPLVRMGFTRIGMADFQAQLASGDETALIAAAKKLFGTAVDRLIFGTTRVVSASKDDSGAWTATVATDAAVWDFKTGEKTWSGRCEATATGKTEAAAVSAARDSVAGSLLPLKLYYNL